MMAVGLIIPLTSCASPSPTRVSVPEALLTADNMTSYHKLSPSRHFSAVPVLQEYYPTDALRKDISGHVVLHCTLQPDSRLHDCAVVEESPSGRGFGDATLRVAQILRVQPLKINGVIVPQEMIEFPLTWKTAAR